MRYLSRTAVVLVFAAALLLALPAHAAPTHRAHATPAGPSLVARLGSAWTQLTHFVASATGISIQSKGPTSTDGGSCIDPNGGCQAQLLRP
jgi:hypothetical protein